MPLPHKHGKYYSGNRTTVATGRWAKLYYWNKIECKRVFFTNTFNNQTDMNGNIS
jgi:hypothetical protein